MKIVEAKKLKPGDKIFWNDPSGVNSRKYEIKSLELDGPYVTIEDVTGYIFDCHAKELELIK